MFTFCVADILLEDIADGGLHKEGHSVKILVTINKGYGRAKVGSFSQSPRIIGSCECHHYSLKMSELKFYKKFSTFDILKVKSE